MLRMLYADKQNVIVPWALLSRMRTLIGSGLWGNAVGLRLQFRLVAGGDSSVGGDVSAHFRANSIGRESRRYSFMFSIPMV